MNDPRSQARVVLSIRHGWKRSPCDAVDDLLSPPLRGRFFEVENQCVHEGAVPAPWRGVDHHSRGFAHGDDFFVLVENLRRRRCTHARTPKEYLHRSQVSKVYRLSTILYTKLAHMTAAAVRPKTSGGRGPRRGSAPRQPLPTLLLCSALPGRYFAMQKSSTHIQRDIFPFQRQLRADDKPDLNILSLFHLDTFLRLLSSH